MKYIDILLAIPAYLYAIFITYLFFRYRFGISETQKIIENHISDIENLSKLSIDYWLKSSNDNNMEVERVFLVKGALHRFLQTRNDIENISGKFKDIYKKDSLELYNICLGDDFEVRDRKINKNKALDISYKTTDLVITLRSIRKETLTIKYFFKRKKSK